MHWLKIVAVIAAALMFSGCVTVAKVQSTKAKAYVADGNIFGTDMYYCDASDGTPECWPVNEQGGDQ